MSFASSMRYMANTTGAIPRRQPLYNKDQCRHCGKFLSRTMIAKGHRCGKQTRK